MEAGCSGKIKSDNKKRIDILLNPKAGTSGNTADHLRQLFDACDDHLVLVHLCNNSLDMESFLDQALFGGADIIVAAGGDGTVSSVARKLVGKTAALGILPMGTLNHFAKDLGVPLDIEEAVHAICRGESRKVDVGEVNGTFFINNVSLGFYPKVLRFRDKLKPYIGKWPAMIAAVFQTAFRLPFFKVKLFWDGNQVRRFAPLIFVGNNPYEMHWPDVGKRLSLEKGVLWVMLLRSNGILSNLRSACLALVGRMSENKDVEVLEMKELVIRSRRRRFSLGVDGELIRHRGTLRFQIHPQKLNVIVKNHSGSDLTTDA